MSIEKIFFGVLRVLTPMGPRFIRPPLNQRLYLLWIFRNFDVLPMQVLSERQQHFINQLCSEHRFVSSPHMLGLEDAPVLGTIEWRRVEATVAPDHSTLPAATLPDGIRQRP